MADVESQQPLRGGKEKSGFESQASTSSLGDRRCPPIGVSLGEEYQVEDVINGSSVANSSVKTRLGFLRRVFGLITLQMVLSIGMISLFWYVDSARSKIRDRQDFVFMGGFALVIISVPLLCFPPIRNARPYNIPLFTLFSLVEAYLLAVTTAYFGQLAIFEGVILTAIITGSFSLFTSVQSNRDISSWGVYLYVLSVSLVMLGVFRLIFPSVSNTANFWGIFGAFLFCVMATFDCQLLMLAIKPDQFILAAFSLYLDIPNLVFYLLQTATRNTRAS